MKIYIHFFCLISILINTLVFSCPTDITITTTVAKSNSKGQFDFFTEQIPPLTLEPLELFLKVGSAVLNKKHIQQIDTRCSFIHPIQKTLVKVYVSIFYLKEEPEKPYMTCNMLSETCMPLLALKQIGRHCAKRCHEWRDKIDEQGNPILTHEGELIPPGQVLSVEWDEASTLVTGKDLNKEPLLMEGLKDEKKRTEYDWSGL